MTSKVALTWILHMSVAECKAEFLFDKKNLPVLVEDLYIPPQNLLRQFGLHWSTCCFGHFELKRKQKVSWVGRDVVGWFMRNVIMQSLEYKWQNWQYIIKTNKINSRFHRDGKPTDLTSPTWGRRRGRMRSQSRPNLNRSSRRRRPENVSILSSLLMFEWGRLLIAGVAWSIESQNRHGYQTES